MIRALTAVVHGILTLIWCAGIVLALPGFALMGCSARIGLWLSGEGQPL